MRKLIIARARKNKRTARMLANSRKDHSIPGFDTRIRYPFCMCTLRRQHGQAWFMVLKSPIEGKLNLLVCLIGLALPQKSILAILCCTVSITSTIYIYLLRPSIVTLA